MLKKKSLKIPQGKAKTDGQTIQWPKDRRTDNTMAKREKDRQYNGQKTDGQTIQWPNEKGQKDKDLKTLHRNLKIELHEHY